MKPERKTAQIRRRETLMAAMRHYQLGSGPIDQESEPAKAGPAAALFPLPAMSAKALTQNVWNHLGGERVAFTRNHVRRDRN